MPNYFCGHKSCLCVKVCAKYRCLAPLFSRHNTRLGDDMKVRLFDSYLNKPLMAMLILGFASGLPIGISGGLLQAWFTQSGVSLKAIGAVTLIGLPYSLKFLWAPLFDVVRFRFLDQYRSWMVILQVAMALIMLLIATLSPEQHGGLIFILAMLLIWCSASQDVVIDAYRIRVLSSAERGLGSAYSIFSWRMAALISGGALLIVAHHWGWQVTLFTMAAFFMVLGCLTVLFIPSISSVQPMSLASSSSFYQSLCSAILNLITRPQFLTLAVFVLLYKLGDALALSLMSNFLLTAQGFSLSELAVAYKTSSLIAGILGAFIGGAVMMRISLFTALWVFGLAQAISNALFVLLALSSKQFAFMSFCVFVESFCSGMSTAAFLAFLISICHPNYPATQFALLSALASLPRIISGPAAAAIVPAVGWPLFFGLCLLLSFPALFILMHFSLWNVIYEEKVIVV